MAKQSALTNKNNLRLSPDDLWAAYHQTVQLDAPVPKQDNYRQKGRSELAPYFKRIDNYKRRIDFFKEPSGKYEHKIRAAKSKLGHLLGEKVAQKFPAEKPQTEVENLQGGPSGRRKHRSKGRRVLHLPNVHR